MEKRLKVLMSAYACEPNRGSEPEVGWQWALQMARFHDVTVVTRANNKPAIECGLREHTGPKPKFLYYDLPDWLVRWKRRGMPVALYYLLWQAGVRRFAGPQLATFDLIHHITFNSFRQPGFWWFCKRPVVLGPLGGGQVCPWRFLPLFGLKMIPEAFRSLSVISSLLYPHLYVSFGAAKRILAANADTTRRIPACFRHKVATMLETGVTRETVAPTPKPDSQNPPRLIWVSRLENIKAAGLLLRAFAEARKQEPGLTLTLVGSGPEEARLKQLAGRLQLNEAVCWAGRIPKADIPALLESHDIFLFTSVRDTSGNVLLEAMAAGLPSITLRHHGAAEIANNECAIRIPPTSIGQTVADMSEAILKLSASATLRRQMGEAGRQRVADIFTWDKKGEQMNAVYSGATLV